ncbi:NAD(P)/FAD-dependent oxidoreductase [Streptomyces cacaoi]
MRRRWVLVVGAGPAGLAAADAALAAGARVTLVDSADTPGGQYHRAPPDTGATAAPQVEPDRGAFTDRRDRVLGHPRSAWLPATAVWALERRAPTEPPGPPRVHLVHGAEGTRAGAGTPDAEDARDAQDVQDAEGARLTEGEPGGGGTHFPEGVQAAGGTAADRLRGTADPDALVLATGAHDRVLPFPGWQLPGVYTAGAAQALAKGERVAVGHRVVVAGSGPFLLPVAASLLAVGATVAQILEAGGTGALARGWLSSPWELPRHTDRTAELARYANQLAAHRVPFRTGEAVVEARGDGRVEEVVTARLRPDWSPVPGTRRTVAVDAVCVSHGFTPQLELPVAAGCTLHTTPGGPFVTVDADQATTVPGVYAAGEITGIAGAPAARAEGALAGWSAAGGDRAARPLAALRRARDQGRAFAERLRRAHPVGRRWPDWLSPDTVICRCEETDLAALRQAYGDTVPDERAARLAARAGLGPCQGRFCRSAVAHLTGRPETPPDRPLAQPVRLGELARQPARLRPPGTAGPHAREAP